MARRIKENRHWAGICVGMTMALVYIEPIKENPHLRVYPGGLLSLGATDARLGPPLGGQGGVRVGRGGARVKATKTKTSKEKKKIDR